jgi:diguanylate cyclase (GGDEF)-like protein
VRNTGRWQDLPIIFLTAQTDLASRLSAFDSGGDDYLPKPVINVELLKRVKVRLDRARMQRERQDRDLLTGLLLRRAFVDHLTALISESERHKFPFTLCLMDVDHFKKVNDNFGHMAGDRVLSFFGKLLRKRFRVEDLRGRWGGEEFILAFKHERKETMQKALNRVLEELKKVEFKGDQGESFYTSFSAGMVDFPEDGTTIHDLVLEADKRLYIAKANGRSQIVTKG